MNSSFISSSKASKTLNIHPNTLRTWESKGLVKSYRIGEKGQRKYDITEFLKNPVQKTVKENIIYCRVSSKGQKEDLNNQINFLKQKYPNYEVISDIGSGLNYKRKGLRTILDKSLKGIIGQVVVTYRDRLCRFGFDLVEYIIKSSGGEIMVLNNTNDSPQEEMVKDLTSIIHVFSCRLYGLRRYKKTIKEAINCEESEKMPLLQV
jgi:putative resolvase